MRSRPHRRPRAAPRFLAALAALPLALTGCTQPKTASTPDPQPDYGRPLPAGAPALRPVTEPERMPDLGAAYRQRDALLVRAIDASLVALAAPSSRRYYPYDEISHDDAVASLVAARELLTSAPSEEAFVRDVLRMFDVYESVGYDGTGTVLFTGYYSPTFAASRRRTTRFRYPLYRRPDDLVTAPVTGEPQGRRTPDGRVVPYATRAEIETGNLLAGRELVWLEDALSAYLVHVNGSAKLRLRDGSVLYIGYAGKTDRPYSSLGQAMVREGLLTRGAVSLPAVRRVARAQPERVETLMRENENFVFFTEYPGDNWPAGSLGVVVTAEASLATDKKIYPPGSLALVDTKVVSPTAGHKEFQRFMLDQDTGGAIRAPGRADIFMGVGPGAEILAGGQHAEGRLYYLFLKPEYLPRYATGEDRRRPG